MIQELSDSKMYYFDMPYIAYNNELGDFFDSCKNLNKTIFNSIEAPHGDYILRVTNRLLCGQKITDPNMTKECLFLLIGYVCTVIDSIAEDNDIDLKTYNSYFSSDCYSNFLKSDVSVISNIRHAFDHSYVSYNKPLLKLVNRPPGKEAYACEIEDDVFINDTLSAIIDFIKLSNGKQKRMLEKILENIISIKTTGKSINEDYVIAILLMESIISIYENIGLTATNIIDGERESINKNKCKKFKTTEILKYDIQSLRNAFAHLDIDIKNDSVTPYNCKIAISKPLTKKDMSKITNWSQMLYQIPIISFCYATLAADCLISPDISKYIPLSEK